MGLLVDREVHGRQDRRCARLLKLAKLKYPQAAIEDLDSRTRGIERSAVMSLALGEWVTQGHAVLITGATGAGKSWLACALAQHACRRGQSAYYQRVPRLGEELRIRHANGTFSNFSITQGKSADQGISRLCRLAATPNQFPDKAPSATAKRQPPY
ncbi:Mobile element protein [Polaromonas sp. CG9_12]|nr:Mobile element protein [Polaromonas sp. CG9_12]